MTEQAEVFNPHQNTTIDGVVITEDLIVWDYNLRVSTVIADLSADEYTCPEVGAKPGYCNKDHWFVTTGGRFNGQRMWVQHPKTFQLAKDAR